MAKVTSFKQLAVDIHEKHLGEYTEDGESISVNKLMAAGKKNPELWANILKKEPTLYRSICRDILSEISRKQRSRMSEKNQAGFLPEGKTTDSEKMAADRIRGRRSYEDNLYILILDWPTIKGPRLGDCHYEDLRKCGVLYQENIDGNMKAKAFVDAVARLIGQRSKKTVSEAISARTLVNTYQKFFQVNGSLRRTLELEAAE